MYYTIEQLNHVPERFSNRELISLHRKNRLNKIFQIVAPTIAGAGYFAYAKYLSTSFFSLKKLAVVLAATSCATNYFVKTQVEFAGSNYEQLEVVDAYRRRQLQDRLFALGYGGDHYSYTDTLKNPRQKAY